MQEDGSFFCCFKGNGVERSISRREDTQLGLNQRRSKLPKGVAVGHEENEEQASPLMGESEGLANGVQYVRGLLQLQKSRDIFTKRGVFISLISC